MVTLDRLAEPSAAEDWLEFGVALMWQDDQPRPTDANDSQRVCAVQAASANNRHRHPLSVPTYPWYF